MNEELETKDMCNEFADIDKKSNNKNYIVIVVILYIVVIILIALLVLGLKNQKDTIINNSENSEVNFNIYK